MNGDLVEINLREFRWEAREAGEIDITPLYSDANVEQMSSKRIHLNLNSTSDIPVC